jgi:hypothetical protein
LPWVQGTPILEYSPGLVVSPGYSILRKKNFHLITESVGLVKAITYRVVPNTTDLVRDENTGAGGQILAEDVENIQIRYTLASGAVVDSPGNPEEIRMVSVSLTVRTKRASRDYPGDGYLRRAMTSDIEVRNLGL